VRDMKTIALRMAVRSIGGLLEDVGSDSGHTVYLFIRIR